LALIGCLIVLFSFGHYIVCPLIYGFKLSKLEDEQFGRIKISNNLFFFFLQFLGVGQCYDKLVGILDSKLAQTRNVFCGSICLSRTGKYAATHANQKVYYTNLASTFIFET
jgi:hypothetical protein